MGIGMGMFSLVVVGGLVGLNSAEFKYGFPLHGLALFPRTGWNLNLICNMITLIRPFSLLLNNCI